MSGALELERRLRARASLADPVRVNGRITRIQGTVIHAVLRDGRIGEEVLLRDPVTGHSLSAEIIGFSGEETVLAPGGDVRGLSNRAEVIGSGRLPLAPAGAVLLGRVVDAMGRPLDGGPAITPTQPLEADPPAALSRPPIDTVFETGLKAIDGPLTLGTGQRVGFFGAAGVGKSTLLSQIIRGARADAIVLGLIGERGREVGEFLQRDLGEEGRKRAAVIVATSDRPATERLRAAHAATAAAEAFRSEGRNTLLLIDSATRVARAIREIGLAAGEPPVRRGFPPSTFAILPRLVERAGRDAHGAITAIYTVLVEGDDDNADPVADELRSLLDGHVILSRELAQSGHFPAIDVRRSRSRVRDAVVADDHAGAARRLNALLSKLDDIELLVQVGEYRRGGDALADLALDRKEAINAFLRQPATEHLAFSETVLKLTELARGAA